MKKILLLNLSLLSLKQKNVGSGDSENSNCGQNTINSLAVGVCPDASVTIGLG
jgi:hypothetical protein